MKTDVMIESLAASAPHPDYAQELALFGQFVGSWNVDIVFHLPDGRTAHEGIWHFGWILEGRAIQDVLLYGPKDGRVGRGTTIRAYDRRDEHWKVFWTGPLSGTYLLLTGGSHDGGIRLEGPEDDALLRWSFSEITSETFQWRGVISRDRGETWQLEQEMSAKRTTPDGSALHG